MQSENKAQQASDLQLIANFLNEKLDIFRNTQQAQEWIRSNPDTPAPQSWDLGNAPETTPILRYTMKGTRFIQRNPYYRALDDAGLTQMLCKDFTMDQDQLPKDAEEKKIEIGGRGAKFRSYALYKYFEKLAIENNLDQPQLESMSNFIKNQLKYDSENWQWGKMGDAFIISPEKNPEVVESLKSLAKKYYAKQLGVSDKTDLATLVKAYNDYKQASQKVKDAIELLQLYNKGGQVTDHEAMQKKKLEKQQQADRDEISMFRAPASADQKDNVIVKDTAPRDITNLLKCYQIALDIKPESLPPKEAKVLGELFVDLLHNATPGDTFLPDYARVMASLSNYNDVMLHAMKLLNITDEKPKVEAKETSKQEATPKQETTQSSLDVKDVDKAAVGKAEKTRDIDIPNHEILKVHLFRANYEPDDKEQKALKGVDLDKIVEEKGATIAANIEKREALSQFFAQNEAWKQLTSYIHDKVKSGTKVDLLDNLIKLKLGCEGELDDDKRSKLMTDLQQEIQKQMGGGKLGLWGGSVNSELQNLNKMLKEQAQQPKVTIKLHDHRS